MPVRDDLRAKFAVFNPHNKPVDELPIIYGFNNGGSREWYSACLIAESGHGMGGHICSAEGFMYGDLGILEGYREDRHEGFRKHYPDGYRMDFVPSEEVFTHPGLEAAYQKNQKLAAEEKPAEASSAASSPIGAYANSVAR